MYILLVLLFLGGLPPVGLHDYGYASSSTAAMLLVVLLGTPPGRVAVKG